MLTQSTQRLGLRPPSSTHESLLAFHCLPPPPPGAPVAPRRERSPVPCTGSAPQMVCRNRAGSHGSATVEPHTLYFSPVYYSMQRGVNTRDKTATMPRNSELVEAMIPALRGCGESWKTSRYGLCVTPERLPPTWLTPCVKMDSAKENRKNTIIFALSPLFAWMPQLRDSLPHCFAFMRHYRNDRQHFTCHARTIVDEVGTGLLKIWYT